MKYSLFFVLFLKYFFSFTQSQDYNHIIVYDATEVCAINGGKEIYTFSLLDTSFKGHITNMNKVVSFVSIDRKGTINVGIDGKIILYQKRNKWKRLVKCRENIIGIVFNDKNMPFIITQKGIMTLAPKKYFFPNNQYNLNPLSKATKYNKKWERGYFSYIIDNKNRIWISIDYGEFGREIYLFDTKSMTYQNVPTQNNNFLDWGLRNLFTDNIAAVYGYTNSSNLSNLIHIDSTKFQIILSISEQVSTVNINPNDSCIYFSSNMGFYKQLQPDSPIFIVKSNQKEYLNIKKITFIDNSRYVFIAEDKKIFYFNGERLNIISFNKIY